MRFCTEITKNFNFVVYYVYFINTQKYKIPTEAAKMFDLGRNFQVNIIGSTYKTLSG